MTNFVEDIISELLQAIKLDLTDRHPFFHRGQLKKENVILCKIMPSLVGSGEEISLSGGLGQYIRTARYDDEFLNRFLEHFTNSARSCKAALDQLSQKSSPYFVGEPGLGSLYLTLFCRKVASDFLLNETLAEDQIKSLADGFTRDLEKKTLAISAKVGVQGIVATEEILIQSTRLPF